MTTIVYCDKMEAEKMGTEMQTSCVIQNYEILCEQFCGRLQILY